MSSQFAADVSPERLHQLLTDGMALHRAGQHAEAERVYRNILRADPANADALHLLGLIAQHAGLSEEAAKMIRRAIDLNPMAPSYWANLASVSEQQGEYDEAERCAREALAIDPNHGTALHCLGNALRAGDRYEEAAQCYELATASIADDAALWSNLGSTLLTLHRHEPAIEAFRRALALSPGQAEMHSNLGNALAAGGDPDGAIAAHEAAIRVDPGFTAAYTNLAGVLLQAGRAAEAAGTLTDCLGVEPGHTKALSLLAIAAREAGDDETRRRLMDYDGLMAARRCAAPPGYDSLEAFNTALVEHVLAHPTLAWERVSKTTRKGSQSGELLDDAPGPVAALETLIREAVTDYIERLPQDSDQPFVAARPDEWKLTIWGVVLEEAGCQGTHLHPTGWLSGVYYAAVPPATPGAPADAGYIEFGRPPEDFPLSREADVRTVEPRPGELVLFPSYFHHRTMPFEGEGQRVSIAFDVMPPVRRPNVGQRRARLSTEELATELGRAQSLYQSNALGEAEKLLDRLLEAAPDAPGVHHLAGMIHFRKGRKEAAVEALQRTVELVPGEPRYLIDLGSCLTNAGRYDEAVTYLERAAEADPAGTDALMRLAMIHNEQGRVDEAARDYERVIERDPRNGGAHYGLAMSVDFASGDPRIARMRQVLDRYTLPPRSEATIAIALGRALDQTGDVAEAMKYYTRGNRAKRGLVPFDIAEERANNARLIESFPRELFGEHANCGDDSEVPVFIVGMPRAGSTLLEQILDSHPRIHGAGEINDLWQVASRLGEWLPPGGRMPEDVGRIGAAGWTELGRRYVARLTAHAADADRIVDKLPFNYTMIGLIRLMLPRARVIHCVRDPRDTCISCYTTSFGNDRGFTTDLAELGETYRLYWRLMQHWQSVLPGMVHEVRYERLVDDLETTTRETLDFLGLEWSDDCLEYHRNPRLVTTASMTQVRQPAYRSSIGRWRRYEPHLGALLEALGDLTDYGIEPDKE
jgi:uncharacterized protein (TIGR02466 family)